MHRTHGTGINGIGRNCPCDAKICHFRFPIHGNNNVLRLYVTVNNTIVVSHLQTGCHLERNTGGLPYRKFSLFANVSLESNSLHQFHHNETDTVLFSHIEHVHYISVSQACGRLRFHPELGEKYPVILKFRFQDLDGNEPIQLMVFRPINIRHPAGTDAAYDFISVLKKCSCF